MKKERVTYIAEDGKVFYSKRRCELYNAVKDKTLEEIISPYLTFLHEKDNGRHWEISENICFVSKDFPLESRVYLAEVLGLTFSFDGMCSATGFYRVDYRWESDDPSKYYFSSIDEKNLRHRLALIMSSLNEIESLKKKMGD